MNCDSFFNIIYFLYFTKYKKLKITIKFYARILYFPFFYNFKILNFNN